MRKGGEVWKMNLTKGELKRLMIIVSARSLTLISTPLFCNLKWTSRLRLTEKSHCHRSEITEKVSKVVPKFTKNP